MPSKFRERKREKRRDREREKARESESAQTFKRLALMHGLEIQRAKSSFYSNLRR